MAKRENVLEKLIGKTKRPEGELEAIDRRLHENTARCFDEVLSLLLRRIYQGAIGRRTRQHEVLDGKPRHQRGAGA